MPTSAASTPRRQVSDGGLGVRGRLVSILTAARRPNHAVPGADPTALEADPTALEAVPTALEAVPSARRSEPPAPSTSKRDTRGLPARYRPGSPLHWDYGPAARPTPRSMPERGTPRLPARYSPGSPLRWDDRPAGR